MTDIGDLAGRAVAAGAGGFVAGGPIGALVAVAASIVPEIVRSLAGDSAGAAATAVAEAVQTVTGTSDPLAAATALAADPAKAVELRIKLLEIQVQAEEARRRDELEAIRLSDADRQASRDAMLRLASAQHALAWMPAYKTFSVDIVFLLAVAGMFALVFLGLPDLPSGVRELLSMLFGVLVGEWRGSNQFWIGGSRAGSQAAQVTTQQALAASVAAGSGTPPPPAEPVARPAAAGSRPTIFGRRNT